MPRKPLMLDGKRFGRLTVLWTFTLEGERNGVRRRVRCDCGKVYNVRTNAITSDGLVCCKTCYNKPMQPRSNSHDHATNGGRN